MSKLLAGVIAALIVGVGVAAASSLTASDDNPVRTSTTLVFPRSLNPTASAS